MTLRNRSDIHKLGTILSIWAHPDDETLACAGIMAKAVSNGQKVVCITATKGESGVQDEQKWPADKLADIRSKELNQALKIIGVDKHHWLDYPDGTCNDQNEIEASNIILRYIEQYQPDTILTFGPDGLTGHLDHITVSNWVKKAADAYDGDIIIFHAVVAQEQYDDYLKEADEKLDIFFNISSPPLVPLAHCDLTFSCDEKTMCDIKRGALSAMPSQTAIIFEHFGNEFVDKAFMYEAFVEDKQSD